MIVKFKKHFDLITFKVTEGVKDDVEHKVNFIINYDKNEKSINIIKFILLYSVV